MNATGTVEIVGKAPTEQDRMLEKASEEFAPEKSLERVHSSAKALLQSVTVGGTLFTALGLLAGERLRDGPSWLLAVAAGALALLALSLGLAAWALVPSVGKLAAGDLNAVGGWYQEQIKRRGNKARAAGIMFALALATVGAAPLLLLLDDADEVEAAVATAWTSDQQPKFTFKLTAAALPEGATAQAKIFAEKAGSTAALYDGTVNASAESKLELAVELPGADAYDRFVVAATIEDDKGKQLHHENATVNKP